MRAVLLLVFELLLVAVVAVACRNLAQSVTVLPASVLAATNAWVTDADLARIVAILLVAHAVVLGVLRLAFGGGVFRQPLRTAQELHGVVIAMSLAAVAIFLGTNVNFSANYFTLTILCVAAVFLLVHFAATATAGALAAAGGVGRAIGSGLWLLLRPLGILAVICAGVPVALAIAYKADHGFANRVNALRMAIHYGGAGGDWQLVDAYPGLTFDQTIAVRTGPDGRTLYVLERPGRLLSVRPGDGLDKQLLLDIQDAVGPAEIENGALGFDLHPRFGEAGAAERGFLYLAYTAVADGRQENRVSRFDLAAGDAAAVRASEQPMITLRRTTYGFHNGGTVEFGPDGLLYLSFGDAKDGANPQRVDRDLYSGVLRLDVDCRPDASHPPPRQPENGRTDGYCIPDDNPFVGRPETLEEFYALGMRNPFRIGFDRETGEVWAGDVGDLRWEEVNRVVPGGNYQWPYREGPDPYGNISRPADPVGREVEPYFAYDHTGYERVIIGGFVYRGDALPDLAGHYLYADNFSGWVRALPVADGAAPEPVLLARAAQTSQVGITSLTPAPDGGVYVTTLGAPGRTDGRLLRLQRGGPADRPAVAETPTPDAGSEVTTADATAIFMENCARCHGTDGAGADLGDMKLPDFTDPAWQDGIEDALIRRVIAEGGAAVGKSAAMPPWDGIYAPAEIDALVPVVRRFGRP